MRALRLEGLSKAFGAKQVLIGMSFEVTGGELFGFVGSNGAGKTTTMRIILGVLAADAGRVAFDGRPVDADLRRRIGYMPEERGLYPKMKVGDQLTYFARLHGLDVAAAQAATALWVKQLNIEQYLDRHVDTLSLGNQQRVQLAAALVHDPDVLVLDEPFAGLDPLAVDIMSEVLRERCDAGVPVIFSSHQLDLVESLCDRVGIMRDGALIANGSVDELTAGRTSRLEVLAPQAPPGWADALVGTRTIEHANGRTLIELAPGTDDQHVLAAALATGAVHGFTRRRERLSEVFRDAVTA
jgi:ABC-2 type transport system ATP-binding protein